MASKSTSTSTTTESKKKKRMPTSSTAPRPDYLSDESKSNPKLKSTSDEGLIAYVHHMSQVKRNKGDTMSYCSFKLQTSENTYQDALLYSLAKRQLLIQSESTRTPVKIKNFAFTGDKSMMVINDMTNISTPQQCEYSFQFAEIVSTENTATVLDVFNNYREWDNVSVRGKIVSVNKPRTVGSPKNA